LAGLPVTVLLLHQLADCLVPRLLPLLHQLAGCLVPRLLHVMQVLHLLHLLAVVCSGGAHLVQQVAVDCLLLLLLLLLHQLLPLEAHQNQQPRRRLLPRPKQQQHLWHLLPASCRAVHSKGRSVQPRCNR